MFITYLNSLILSFSVSCILLFSAVRSEYFLAFFMMLRPLLQPSANLGYNFGSFPVTGIPAVIFILFGFFYFIKRIRYHLSSAIGVALLLFVFFSIPSFFVTLDWKDSVAGFLKILVAVVAYFFAVGVDTEKKIKLILFALFGSQIIPVTYGLYQKISGIRFDHIRHDYFPVDRVGSIIGSYNDYGIFLVMVFIASVALLKFPLTKKQKLLIYFILALNIFSLIYSKNRGTWISFPFSIIMASFFYRSKVNLIRMLIIGMLISIMAMPIVIDRFEQLHKKDKWGQSQDTFSGRLHYFKILIPLGLENAITGNGINMASIYMEKISGISDPPHNDYLRIFFEVGAIPLILYVFVLFFVLFKTIQCRKEKDDVWFFNYCMLIAIIYQSVISLTQHPSYNLNNFPQFMVLIGLWDSIRLNRLCRG